MSNTKNLVNEVINVLHKTDTFSSPFISKVRLKRILLDEISKSENPIQNLENIIDVSIKKCITMSIMFTVNGLLETNLIESVVTENGNIGYRLKNNNINKNKHNE